jgi:hypothetical protein
MLFILVRAGMVKDIIKYLVSFGYIASHGSGYASMLLI